MCIHTHRGCEVSLRKGWENAERRVRRANRYVSQSMASASALALLARPGGGHGRRGGEWAPARPSAGSLLGRLRVSSAWRGPCAALRKAAGGEGASGASTGRCAPPAAGGGPCRRVPAPWTGQGGGAAAPRPPLLAGAALCCLVSSLLGAGSVCGVGEAAVALYSTACLVFVRALGTLFTAAQTLVPPVS